MITIRPLTAADVESGARCHLACWREAYAGIVPAEALARVTADEQGRISTWRSFVDREPPRWVAVDGAEVVGFAHAGPNREPAAELWELYAIYVRRSQLGTGLGARLLDASLGERDATVWVFRDNERARAFYERHGFRPDGTEALEETFGAVEIRMTRRGLSGS